MYNFELTIICYICKKKKFVVADLRKFKILNSQKDWVRKSQIRKVSPLRKVHKSNKLYKSANCDLRKLFADWPPLVICNGRLYPTMFAFRDMTMTPKPI